MEESTLKDGALGRQGVYDGTELDEEEDGVQEDRTTELDSDAEGVEEAIDITKLSEVEEERNTTLPNDTSKLGGGGAEHRDSSDENEN